MKLRFLLLFLTLLPVTLPAQSAPDVGKPFVVRHLHQTTGVSTSLSNAITAQGSLYEAGRMTGNIWRLVPRASAK